ncbi:MAG: AraC family transcriptional regulator [Lachnospiraceae bacterium]
MFTPVYIRDMTMLPFYVKGAKQLEHQNEVQRKLGLPYFAQVMLCTQGCGTFIDHNNVVREIKEGDVLYFMSRTPHSYYPVTSVWKTKYIVFGGSKAEAVMNQIGYMPSGIISTQDDYSVINQLFDDIILQHYLQTQHSAAACSSCLYRLIIRLSDRLSQSDIVKRDKKREKLSQVLSLIETQYHKPLSLSDLATAANVTPEYLARLFRSAYDTTPIAYLNKIRIQNAEKLLSLHSNMKIKEVAAKCGFLSSGYFSKVFRQYTGYLPEEYHELHIYTREEKKTPTTKGEPLP